MAENKHVRLEDALAAAKTREERDQILKEYEKRKLADAERREQMRLDSPSIIDKFMDGVKALKNKVQKKSSHNRMPTQKTR